MASEVKVGSRIIGTLRQDDDDTWSYEANFEKTLMGLNEEAGGFKCRDDAVRALRSRYKDYALKIAELPPDLNWHTLPGVKGREFLTRPNYTKDSKVYGQRKAIKPEA